MKVSGRNTGVSWKLLMVVWFAIALLISSGITYAADMTVTIKDFGATGDGRANDTDAFRKAFASGCKNIYIPSGTYLVGPETLTVPSQVYIHGDGGSSVLTAAKGSGTLLSLGPDVRLSSFAINGDGITRGEFVAAVVMLPNEADRITIDGLRFTRCDRACIVTDRADDLMIKECDFRDVGLAISLQFSKRVKIRDNSVFNCRLHGIQFWGNWKWERKESEDITITGNYVKDGGGGGIWGVGARRVVVSNNIVDGATDVGIDLEWCEDSVISANTVRNFENGGISLFFSCERVAITGNTVKNDRPIADPKAAWWARAGIWLTYLNRETFPNDFGHSDITITGNVIYCEPGDRRAMWIGTGSDNIVLGNNAIRGGDIWSGGGQKDSPMKKIKDNTVVRSAGKR